MEAKTKKRRARKTIYTYNPKRWGPSFEAVYKQAEKLCGEYGEVSCLSLEFKRSVFTSGFLRIVVAAQINGDRFFCTLDTRDRIPEHLKEGLNRFAETAALVNQNK